MMSPRINNTKPGAKKLCAHRVLRGERVFKRKGILMPKFPKIENDIMALADQMCVGLANHAADFPSVTVTERTTLQEVFDNCRSVRIDQENAKSAAQIATVAKDESVDTLVTLMKNALKKAETDTVNDPEKLTEIGWGPRQQPQPVAIPGQPENFITTAEGPGDVWFKWDSPQNGGLVRNYIIERRQQPTGGSFGMWEIVGTSLSNDIHLLEQPRGIQLEYCVKAVNVSGESLPSNTAAVVL